VAVGLGSDCMLKPYLRLAIRCYAALGTGRLQGSLAVLLTWDPCDKIGTSPQARLERAS